ncbi:Ig-like domain-containing protein [Dorea longicatena]|uniref:Ig-like domain-containing protein n=1 Tax=Dorea longicatena TaxID=88431 RepID=UPI0032C050FC
MARVKKLKQDLADAEDDLNTTKQDHKDDLIDQGFQKLSDDLNQMLEDTEYEISHNADKQNEIIQSMLNKQVGMYQEAYSKINSIIKNTGWVGSNDFNNNQSQMSSQTGAQNQASNASQSQQTANSKPSSSASGTDTSGIKDNASENNKITENIMKPENTTNRPVAELKVSKNSVYIEEGKSTSVTTKIRPNDAANKKLSWKSSNTAIATVSNGTISGKKPGSCQITVSTTDGSGISKTIAVTVTKKPDPPKPVIPSNKGGDGVPRVGDVVTFNGKYYYDS